jgi:hypothetical protein
MEINFLLPSSQYVEERDHVSITFTGFVPKRKIFFHSKSKENERGGGKTEKKRCKGHVARHVSDMAASTRRYPSFQLNVHTHVQHFLEGKKKAHSPFLLRYDFMKRNLTGTLFFRPPPGTQLYFIFQSLTYRALQCVTNQQTKARQQKNEQQQTISTLSLVRPEKKKKFLKRESRMQENFVPSFRPYISTSS